jgi:hypothetical protein
MSSSSSSSSDDEEPIPDPLAGHHDPRELFNNQIADRPELDAPELTGVVKTERQKDDLKRRHNITEEPPVKNYRDKNTGYWDTTKMNKEQLMALRTLQKESTFEHNFDDKLDVLQYELLDKGMWNHNMDAAVHALRHKIYADEYFGKGQWNLEDFHSMGKGFECDPLHRITEEHIRDAPIELGERPQRVTRQRADVQVPGMFRAAVRDRRGRDPAATIVHDYRTGGQSFYAPEPPPEEERPRVAPQIPGMFVSEIRDRRGHNPWLHLEHRPQHFTGWGPNPWDPNPEHNEPAARPERQHAKRKKRVANDEVAPTDRPLSRYWGARLHHGPDPLADVHNRYIGPMPEWQSAMIADNQRRHQQYLDSLVDPSRRELSEDEIRKFVRKGLRFEKVREY